MQAIVFLIRTKSSIALPTLNERGWALFRLRSAGGRETERWLSSAR